MLGLHLQGIFGWFFFFAVIGMCRRGPIWPVVMTTTRFKHKQK